MNKKNKICSNCIYYREKISTTYEYYMGGLSKTQVCELAPYTTINLVNGEEVTLLRTCRDERITGACGPKGKRYQPKGTINNVS